MGTEVDDLRELVQSRQWYHTIELQPGLVTPGWFDARGIVEELPLPRSLEGKRCLDIGTFDGFWALELARRGAAEVITIDVPSSDDWDWPVGVSAQDREVIGNRFDHGRGFEIVAEALGSSVERRELSVYDLSPDVIGEFDFVYWGSLQIHLRDPVAAFEAVRSVCRGRLLIVDAYDIEFTVRFPRRPIAQLEGVGRPWWWQVNVAGLIRLVEAGGFELLSKPRRFMMPPGPGQGRPLIKPVALRHKAAREALLRTRVGDPHVAIVARPRAGLGGPGA